MSNLLPATAPANRRVRAYFAPVERTSGTATLWDPAGLAGFNVDAPPAPWLDLGWCTGFTRRSATRIQPLFTGAPGTAATQVRTEVEATVAVEFQSWGKLQLALTAGTQQMNVLATQPGTAANGSGGTAIAAVPVQAGSTATTLILGAAAAGFSVGDLVVVDLDYAGTTGYVGSGASGGYVKSATAIGSDTDYVRRVSLNVARVTANDGAALTLGAPLLAGAPAAGMQVSKVAGFCDREGGSFFQEWSALFLLPGEQGDAIAFHYPRLQATAGPAEQPEALLPRVNGLRLSGSFRALPVPDANDGELIVCFRSYLPAAMRAI